MYFLLFWTTQADKTAYTTLPRWARDALPACSELSLLYHGMIAGIRVLLVSHITTHERQPCLPACLSGHLAQGKSPVARRPSRISHLCHLKPPLLLLMRLLLDATAPHLNVDCPAKFEKLPVPSSTRSRLTPLAVLPPPPARLPGWAQLPSRRQSRELVSSPLPTASAPGSCPALNCPRPAFSAS